jgi:hypothetical protein
MERLLPQPLLVRLLCHAPKQCSGGHAKCRSGLLTMLIYGLLQATIPSCFSIIRRISDTPVRTEPT